MAETRWASPKNKKSSSYGGGRGDQSRAKEVREARDRIVKSYNHKPAGRIKSTAVTTPIYTSPKPNTYPNSKSDSPSVVKRIMLESEYGMSDRSKTEYNRLEKDHAGWGDLNDSQRVQLARKPQMDEQLAHAFTNNPTTKAQKDIFQKHGKAPVGSHRFSDGTSKLMFDGSDNTTNSQSLKTPEPPTTETLLTGGDQGINSKLPDWQKKRKAGQRKHGYGRRGNLLRGISDDALTIGYTLLSGSN